MSTSYLSLNNGLKMPLIGLGTFQNRGSILNNALDIGYRLIDTAYIYENEKEIGETLKHILEETSIRREDIFIVSKLPNNGHRKVKYFLQKTLDAFQLNYLDLYLIHTPFAVKGKHDLDMYPVDNGKIAIDEDANLLETWKSMEEVVDLGMTKSIGLSNVNIKQLSSIYESARIKPANVQVECHVYLPQTELLSFCKRKNITLTAYSPLGSPFLPEFALKNFGIVSEGIPMLLDESILKTLADKYERTSAQIALRWLTQRGIAVIPKSAQGNHLKENFEIFDFELSPEDILKIDNIERRYRYYKFDFIPGMKDYAEYPFNEYNN